MSRKLFAFLLAELKVVRLTCPKCQAATELSVDQMCHRIGDRQCPVCRADWAGFHGADEKNLLHELGKAIKALQSSPAAATIEFVLPDTTEG